MNEWHWITYETYCRFGALRNPALLRRWCDRCRDNHYYARDGVQLVCLPGL